MKRSLKNILAILIVMLLSAGLFAEQGIVTFVKGKVEVKRGNSWIALNVGDKVSESEIINTGFQSEAKVKLMESILYLGPVTRVTLSTLSSDDTRDKVNVYLSTGTVRSQVNRTETKRVSYTVRTPIAVASVRGTGFAMDSLNNMYGYSGAVAGGIIEDLKYKEAKAKKKAAKQAAKQAEKENKKKEDSGAPSGTVPGEQKETPQAKPETSSDLGSGSTVDDNFDGGAFTDTVDLPTGGIIVLPGNNLNISMDNMDATPQKDFDLVVDEIIGAASTASEKEAVVADKPITETVNDAAAPEIVEGPKFGSISITIGSGNSNENTNVDVEVQIPTN